MKRVYKVRRADGSKQEMTYDEVCDKLGFISDAHFVEVTTAGTISFTLGKPHEVRALLSSVRAHGFVPAQALVRVCSQYWT